MIVFVYVSLALFFSGNKTKQQKKGVMIMVFRCILNDEVRTAIKERWKRHKNNRVRYTFYILYSLFSKNITSLFIYNKFADGQVVVNDDE